MKSARKLSTIAVAACMAIATSAIAEPWTPSVENGKNYLSKDGWKLEYTVLADGISIASVNTWGTSTSIDFASIKADTGLTVRKLGGFKKDNAADGFITNITIPDTVVEIFSGGFKNHPIANDLNFTNNPVVVGGSAFYGHRAASVRITQTGSIVGDSAFSSGNNLAFVDIRGVSDLGPGAFSRGSNYSITEAIVSTCLTNIGSQAFNQQRNMILTVLPPSDPDSVYDGDVNIGSQAFRDCGASAAKHELVLPFKGKCIIGSQAFNWMQNTTNFVFWGKVPTFASDAFNSCSALNEKGIITCCPDVDSDWLTFGLALDSGDEDKAGFPKNGECFRKYVNSGVTFWVCRGDSPYAGSGPTPKPQIGECQVVKSASGYTVSGSVVSGLGKVLVRFGNLEYAITGEEATGPFDFAKTFTISDAAGGLYSSTCYLPVVVATNSAGKSSTWTAASAIYTGDISVSKLGDAAEQGLVANSFRISRANTAVAKAYPLPVMFTLSGTAQAGQDYAAVATAVTIPAGEDHVDVRITPMFNSAVTVDTYVTMTVNAGNYGIGTASATMTIVNAAVNPDDVYVDANVGSSGNGSIDSPFKTIREGVAAAKSGGIVWVKGGVDRTYTISDANDVIVVNKDDVTIKGYDQGAPADCNDKNNMATLEVANGFAAAANGRPVDFAPIIVSNANCRISGICFSLPANSYGQNNYHTGSLVYYSAPFLTFETCSFEQTGNITGNYGIFRTNSNNATNFLVSGCSVKGCYSSGVMALVSGARDGAEMAGCVLSNVCRFANAENNNPTKGCSFVSNRVVNCSNGTTGFFAPAANGSMKNVSIAYNVFYVTDSDTRKHYLITHGGQYGGSFNTSVSIHHNTIVGYDCFVFSEHYRNYAGDANCDTWTPAINNNLILLHSGGTNIIEKTTLKTDSSVVTLWLITGGNYNSSSFMPGSIWSRNALLGEFNAITTPVDGYDLLGCLTMDGNVGLTMVPTFISMDPSSENFYRFKSSVEPNLVFGKHDWIGAAPPLMMGSGSYIVVY